MQISIKQYTFQLSEPYRVGDVITEAEAQALNSLRGENVRNNVADRVHYAISRLPVGEMLSPGQKAELQEHITKYASNYMFQLKQTRATKHDPIVVEAGLVAAEILESRKRSESWAPTIAEYEIEHSKLVSSGNVLVEATRRVEVRAKVAADGLAELMK